MNQRRRPSGEPPPLPRELDTAALLWAAVFGFWVIVWAWFFVFGGDELGVWITKRDLEAMGPIVGHRAGWLDPAMRALNLFTLDWAVPLFGWTTIVAGVVTRRFRHLVIHLAVLCVIATLWAIVAAEIQRPRPINVEIIGAWESYAHPSRPIALITPMLIALALMVAPAGPLRHRAYAATGALLALVGFAQIYVGVEHPTDVAVSVAMGVAVTLLAFRVFAPERVFPIAYTGARHAHLDITGARGTAISAALDRQLGLEAATITYVGLDGSSGSTPLKITLRNGNHVFAKLYATSHLRSDRWYKLGRTLMYGRLEDEHRFTSVRRLVGHEDHMLRTFRDVGLAVPEPKGIVEITPDREYLVVMALLDDATELGEVAVTAETIDSALLMIRRMWDNGLAHRDIKPANVMLNSRDQLWLIDVAFAAIRPTPWRQAVDLANMMLVLALQSSAPLVHQRARLVFTDDELAEAFAASTGVTLPSGLRRELKTRGDELVADFRALVPARDSVSIQRWSWRRIGLTLAMIAGGIAATLATVDGFQELGYFG